MAEAVRSNPAAADLLSGDLAVEASVFAHDSIYNVDIRSRPDGWRKDIAALIDLKTTVDPSQKASPVRWLTLATTSKINFTDV